MLYKAKCRLCKDIIIARGRLEKEHNVYRHLLQRHPKIIKQDEQVQRKIEVIRHRQIKPLEEKLKHFDVEVEYKITEDGPEI